MSREVFTPTTRPHSSARGPPEFPGLMEASCWIRFRPLGSVASRVSVPRLMVAAWYGTLAIRSAATNALGEIGTAPSEVIPVLVKGLEDNHSDVVCAAANALARYGRTAEAAEPRLLATIGAAAAISDHSRLPSLVAALSAISPDATTRLRTFFGDRDPEGLNYALDELPENEG